MILMENQPETVSYGRLLLSRKLEELLTYVSSKILHHFACSSGFFLPEFVSKQMGKDLGEAA